MKFMKIFLAALLAFVVGSVLTAVLWIMMLAGIAASFGSAAPAVPRHAVLKIDFSADITDSPDRNPFANIDFAAFDVRKSVSLYDVLCALDAAKSDERIEGILLRMNGGAAVSATTLEELRAAIAEFRAESGKPVLAYSEAYSQSDYYLATAADYIYIQPQGVMMWQGVGFNLAFFKGLLDKLDIRAEVFRPTACKYKSAVEPYILNAMSPENRRQMEDLAKSIWATITSEVSEARGLSVAQLDALANQYPMMLPSEAIEAKLIDGEVYEYEIDNLFGDLGATTHDDEVDYITLTDYIPHVAATPYSSDKIAVIYAEGDIVDGGGSTSEVITAESLTKRLREARKESRVKAVVLRVNSPGGSAVASDAIYAEMQLLRNEKPLIVSMGSYAASGGYYISAPADAIIADRLTLTGSVGVFGLTFDAGRFFNNKLGVHFDGVGTNDCYDVGNVMRPVSPVERAAMMRGVDNVYEVFTSLVAENRHLSKETVLENLAGGRVWSGAEAVENGLADGNGGLKTAIAVAADKAGLAEFRVEEIVDEPDGLAAIFSAMNARIRTANLKKSLGSEYALYEAAGEVLSRRGIQSYCPWRMEF